MDNINANSHPFQVVTVQGDGFYANSHPYKVTIVGGGGGTGGEARVVDKLPDVGEVGYIYLVLKEHTSQGDIYDEFVWALQQDGKTYDWEHLGTTSEVHIKLYDTTGQNTDGAMTQKAVTDELKKNASFNIDGQDPGHGIIQQGTEKLELDIDNNTDTTELLITNSGSGATYASATLAHKKYVDDLLKAKVFVAEYNVTTAEQIKAYIDSTNEPFAPILVKRGNDYYTAVLSTQSGDESVIVRVLGSGSGDFIIFTYTVTGSTWTNSSHTLQKKLVSGTDIKTLNGETLLGSGDIEIDAYTKEEIEGLLEDKQDKLTAGDNITIQDNEISASIVKVLTTDDYNYDSDGDGVNDCVATWLLPQGFYFRSGSDVQYRVASNYTNDEAGLLDNTYMSFILVQDEQNPGQQGKAITLLSSQAYSEKNVTAQSGAKTVIPQIFRISAQRNGTITSNTWATQFMSVDMIVDSLKSSSPSHVLSAKQGKILDEKISSLQINKADKYNTYTKSEVDSLVDTEKTAREDADEDLQSQIDALSASSDVKDVVGTKAELDAYDKSTLGDNDIIKVLNDESQNDARTYYRYNATTQTFTLIGSEGVSYTKAETNALLDEKQDELTAGEGIKIENTTISIDEPTAKQVELTQAEYDALSQEEKMNGTIYFITDAEGSGGKTYTSGKGITVDNVNDTISVNEAVSEFTGQINYYTAGGQGETYSAFEFLSTSESGDERMNIWFPAEGVRFADDVSGSTYLLRPTETINDTDWSALWQ